MATQAVSSAPSRTQPSPTLSNIDMVLPNEPRKFAMLPSPPRKRNVRPPSPSYLKEQTSDSSRDRSGSIGDSMPPTRKEKRGLMSRKMMLLRSRTASNNAFTTAVKPTLPENDSVYAVPPSAVQNGNHAPAEPLSRWSSNEESSGDSDDMSALPQFLAKYETNDMSGTDDELESSPAVARYGYAASNFTSNLEAERRQKEEEEQNSAILSKRAEEILANAKKRLNLMEGNLRGARDLVAPLTAANLKRATSIASYVTPTANVGLRNRYLQDGIPDHAVGQPYRSLQSQTGTPTAGRDYQGHWRGFSETELPERPYTALDSTGSPIIAQGFIPTKANDPLWTKTLKGSRSHDSLGNLAFRRPGSRDPFNIKNSPDPNLEPLVEDDDPMYAEPVRSTSSQADSRDGSSRYRGASTPDDLHEQMSSLKGRISALKERAKEDSIRRQSIQNLRDPSPLNYATDNAPEFFYGSSPSQGTPRPEVTSAKDLAVRPANGVRQESYETIWEPTPEPTPLATGSRNAFAEQAERVFQKGHERGSSAPQTGLDNRSKQNSRPVTSHKRTPSGTAVIQSSKHRYSHHQLYHVRDMQATYGADEPIPRASTLDNTTDIGTAHDGSSHYGDDEDSQADVSVYEEAQEEPHQPVLAHEDRDDAFDYEHFFLHSAMAYYGERRDSMSSDDSIDSVSTERGPRAAAEDFDDDDGHFNPEDNNHSPDTPQTPEELRPIELNLHRRTFSDETVSTTASFATATEGNETPDITTPHATDVTFWPVPPSDKAVRPSTAVSVQKPTIALSDSSSERADSGVAMNGGKTSSNNSSEKVPTHKSSLSNSSLTNSTLSPPASPNGNVSQDPATVAVNALLKCGGRSLGLRDKALLFGLVESLKTVCQSLQENGESSQENRMLRRRLDDARRVLSGISGEVRPGTS